MALKAETEAVNVNGEANGSNVSLNLRHGRNFSKREVQRYSQW